MRKPIFSVSITALTVLLTVAISLAQTSCEVFLEQALEAVDTACVDLGRNQACYGFNRVEASFLDTVDEDFFTEPADVTEVSMIETIRTAPFNIDTNEWGVAVMVLQANMPDTLPGQNVTFILMGDTEIENAVHPDDAFDPVAGIDVTVTYPQGAAIRSGPGDNFNTIGGVVVGTVFQTDGVSVDGNWLRIVWEERPAWIRRTTVDAIPEIDILPTLSADLNTPMQAFYLRTGIGQPTCSEVPDNGILVQGPEDVAIEITVNGANIELGSSGVLRVVEVDGEPQLEITVLDGEFVVKADENNPQDVVIRAGQRSRLCLEDGNNEGINGEADDLIVTCGASTPVQVDFSDIGGDWCAFESVPEGLLNYPLQTCSNRTHTVQAGENLFRIAGFYCVTISDLQAINGITDSSQIFVGQELILPPDACDGSGSTRPPAGVVDPVTDDPGTDGEPVEETTACVSLISPLVPVNSGNQTFTWTPYNGEGVLYQLVFYDFQGLQVETFLAETTSYTLNLGRQTSTGGEFSWSVKVIQNDVFVCESSRSPVLVRTGELNPPSNATISVSCFEPSPGVTEGTVTWSDLPQGQSISMVLTNGSLTAPGGPFTASSGNITLSIPDYAPATITATTTGGDTVTGSC
mgnify:CR=1 FL=1